MAIFLKIAWRNITRNKYRSLITVAAVAIGFLSLIFIRAFVDGAHSQMIENYTDLISSHLQVHTRGFQDNPSLSLSLRDPDKIAAVLKTTPHVQAFTFRVKEYVLLSSSDHSSGVLLLGIADNENLVCKLTGRIRPGTAPANETGIAIGKVLAKNLNVKIGDKVVVMAQGFDGSLCSGAYRISGLIDTGAEDIDRGMAIMTLKAAQELLVMDKNVSETLIRIDSLSNAKLAAGLLSQKLNDAKLEILTWEELSPILNQWVEFDLAFIGVILFIVLLVVAAGILNTMLMGILERTREFGIMLALGTKRSQIMFMVSAESLLLGLMGIFIGGLVGSLLSFYYGIRGIDLSRFSSALNDYYTGSVIFTRLSPRFVIEYGAIVLIAAVLVALYPAWKAAKLNPVEAIRKG